MFPKPVKNPVAPVCALFLTFAAAGCTQSASVLDEFATSSHALRRPAAIPPATRTAWRGRCSFESHRSSREGMIAVGTVVMNRVEFPPLPEQRLRGCGSAKPVRARRDVAFDELAGAAGCRRGSGGGAAWRTPHRGPHREVLSHQRGSPSLLATCTMCWRPAATPSTSGRMNRVGIA